MTVITTTRKLITGATIALVGAAVAVSLPAAAAPVHHHATPAAARPVIAGSDYLALGDSITFGFREPTNTPTPDYTDASKFVSYPQRVGQALGLTVANAACPGETSASLNDMRAKSYGCETNAAHNGPGYRSAYPLHESYSHSQLKYGVAYLKSHPNTRLVSLQIGANDGFLCQANTTDGCMSQSELGALVTKIEKNVGVTLAGIRNTAHYTGQIVILNYYSTNYSNSTTNLQSQVINNALDTGAANYNVSIADGYKAFQKAAAQSGGDTCAAGLLTILSGGGCGVHPSLAGQAVLAGAVESEIKK